MTSFLFGLLEFEPIIRQRVTPRGASKVPRFTQQKSHLVDERYGGESAGTRVCGLW